MASTTDSERINIVWLKRDLRLQDHAPLAAACRLKEPLLLLYIVEPMLLRDPHYSARHWRFVWQSIEDLDRQLQGFGARVQLSAGAEPPVFDCQAVQPRGNRPAPDLGPRCRRQALVRGARGRLAGVSDRRGNPRRPQP